MPRSLHAYRKKDKPDSLSHRSLSELWLTGTAMTYNISHNLTIKSLYGVFLDYGDKNEESTIVIPLNM